MSDHSITSLIEKLEAGPVYLTHKEAYDLAVALGSDVALSLANTIRKAFAGKSLDAAVALAERVLPGHDWSLGHLPTSDDADHQEHHEFGCFFYAHPHVASRQDGLGHGATAPLAMVTAILRAQSEARV